MNKLEQTFKKILKEANSQEISISIDEQIISLFNYVDEFIDLVKNIVTKGGLFNESRAGDVILLKAQKVNDEITRIFNRIYNMMNPLPGILKQNPDIEQTNEFIDILNEDQIPQILKWMDKVFRNYPRNGRRPYDNDDKRNMYDVCFAFKEFVDSLRVLISRLGPNYILPIEFELTHHYP